MPFPICYLFVSVFGWLDRPPICGPMPLMQLLLTLHRAFWTRPVERSGSLPFVDLYQLLPPSEMAGYQLPPSEMAVYLLHLFAPSEVAACWK